jgi:uncharacterized protein (DUF1501 family)
VTWDISRRIFLKGAGLAVVGVGADPSSLLTRVAEAAVASDRILVHVFLRGGADGLNMVVPYGDPDYYDARGEIALPGPGKAGGVVRLDDQFGLHPGMAALKPLYVEGRLAFVHAMGNYQLTRSHFSAQDFSETGTPGVRGATSGSLTRTLQGLPGRRVTKAVSFSTQTPLALMGEEKVLVALNLRAFRLRAKNWQAEAEQRLRAMYEGTPLAAVTGEIFEGIESLRTVLSGGDQPANGAVYPAAPVGNSLRQAAQIIKAGVGSRCIFCGVSGNADFDTHALQLDKNAVDYPALASALAAFDRDLGRAIDRVVVVVTTEFGRSVRVNGSRGTDHGTAFCGMVLGGGVKGGRIYGRWPGLKKSQLYEDRDLAVTTDFRDVFLEVARKHLRIADPGPIFPGYAPGSGPALIA